MKRTMKKVHAKNNTFLYYCRFFFALQTLSFKSFSTLLQIFQVRNPGEEKRLLSMMLIWLRNMQVTNFSYMFLIFERQK